MKFQRENQSSVWSPKNSPAQPTSQFASRSFAIGSQQESEMPPTQEQIENEAFGQQKFEATGLEIKQKDGSITPQEQKRLGVLQAKMDGLLAQRVERASRFGHNFANITVLPSNQSVAAPIQAKLTIGQPGDMYEQEADSVAHEVVSQINQPQSHTLQRNQEMMGEQDSVQTKPEITLHHRQIASLERSEMMGEQNPVQMASGSLQRKEMSEEDEQLQMKPMVQPHAEGGMAAPPNLEASVQQAKGGGQPLGKSVREPMERAFGADFSGVRVHTDVTSDALNQSIQAKAFTTGEDIFFRQGVYEPSSQGGQELLAHELTHVVQQNSTSRKNIQSVVNRISPFLIQRSVDKEKLKQQIKTCKTPADMGSYLNAKVKVKNLSNKQWTLRKLSQIGLATIEYIYENKDEGDIDSTEIARLNAAVYWIDKSDKNCSSKADIIAETEAVMETIASKARFSEGSGLLHTTGDKQWAYQKPPASTPERLATEEEQEKHKFWHSPTDKPAPTDATPDLVHTPGGSEMHRITSYRYASPGGTQHATHTYAKGVPPREPDLAATVAPTGTPKLGPCPVNFKRVGPVEINKKLLDSWASQRQGWKPDQNTAMKNTSAKEAAASSGYPTNKDWQWLHLIAFTFGGHDGKQPNAQENLVAGLAAANGFHLVLENLVKKMILSGYTDKIEIEANARIKTTSYHVAEKILYLLKWKDSSGKDVIDEFTINTLDPNKAMGGHLSMLYTQFAIDSSPVHHATTKEYNDAIANLQKGQPVGTSKAAQAAYASYQDGIKALQAGNPVRPSKAAQAAEKDYQDTISDLQAGNPVGLSEAAQAADTDYNNAITAIQAGNAVGVSAAAQAADADYNNAITAIRVGNAVGVSAAAQAADADYRLGFNDASTGMVLPAQPNNPGYMAGFKQVRLADHNAEYKGSDLSAEPSKKLKGNLP
jgi:hypothetical protein